MSKLSELVSDTTKLKQAIKENPEIVLEQDENGRTLLHYAAEMGIYSGRKSCNDVLDILFESQNLDLTIKDNKGNTPMHLVAFYAQDRETYETLLPRFVKQAVKTGFDFGAKNLAGDTVLHIAASNEYKGGFTGTFYVVGPHPAVKVIFDHAPKIDLEVLNGKGLTALQISMHKMANNNARELVKAGASLYQKGEPWESPMECFTRMIREVKAKKLDSLQVITEFRDELIESSKEGKNGLAAYKIQCFWRQHRKQHATLKNCEQPSPAPTKSM